MFLEEFGSYCSLEDIAVIAFGAIWHPPKCLFIILERRTNLFCTCRGEGGGVRPLRCCCRILPGRPSGDGWMGGYHRAKLGGGLERLGVGGWGGGAKC